MLKRALWTLAALGLAYVLCILALMVPTVQRNAIYAHKVNPALWQNLLNVEQFGFLHHQVQPFTVLTPDNVTLFAWHVLPVHLYRQHERALKAQADFGLKSYDQAVKTVGLRILLNDPNAIVVVSLHGNAAHLASSYRPPTYQQYLGLSTPEKPVHVIAFDYRGFGVSTGSPTEDGVVQDVVSLLSAMTGNVAVDPLFAGAPPASLDGRLSPQSVAPSRIIITGQSMGTFISTALYHEWVLRLRRPAFRGLVLFASFTSLTKLVESYSVQGITPPLLSPLSIYPPAQRWLLSKIVDQWETSRRLVELAQSADVDLDLTIMHAEDDWDIPWQEGRRNWNAVANAVRIPDVSMMTTSNESRSLDRDEWISKDGKKRLRWERVKYGGHNRIPTSEQAKLALLRLIEGTA